MNSFSEALQAFYQGEVLGEAVYSALVASAQAADERLKWGTLLQLETETKAWLRAPMLAHGVSLEERVEDRQAGHGLAEGIKALPWAQQMRGLHDALLNEVVPRYQGFADAARARGSADEESICVYMVEHEKAQVEFARRELEGAKPDQSLAPIVRFLKYPLER